MPFKTNYLSEMLSPVLSGDGHPIRSGDGSVVLPQHVKDEFIASIADDLANRLNTYVRVGKYGPDTHEGVEKLNNAIRDMLSDRKSFAAEFMEAVLDSNGQSKDIAIAAKSLVNTAHTMEKEAELALMANFVRDKNTDNDDVRLDLAFQLAVAIKEVTGNRESAKTMATPELAEALVSIENATNKTNDFNAYATTLGGIGSVMLALSRSEIAEARINAEDAIRELAVFNNSAEMQKDLTALLGALKSEIDLESTKHTLNQLHDKYAQKMLGELAGVVKTYDSAEYVQAINNLEKAGEQAYNRLDNALNNSVSSDNKESFMAREGRLLGSLVNSSYAAQQDTHTVPEQERVRELVLKR